MASTAALYGLKKTIVRELQDLRMWRRLGDDEGVERCNEHLNDMCTKHYQRMRVYGTLDNPRKTGSDAPSWQGNEIRYRTAHVRLTRSRGPASGYLCVDCGDQAREWSYDHGDPNELTSDRGAPYSPDPDRYQPRCISRQGTPCLTPAPPR